MEDNEQSEPKPTIVTNKPVHKHWATWLLALLVLLLLAGGGYLWMQLQSAKDKEELLNKQKQQLQQQIDNLKKDDSSASEAATEEACNDTASATMKTNIKAALDSKNTAAFSTYVTDPVRYVLAASEYGGNISAAEATTSLNYTHSATGPWDFSLPQATLDAYDAGGYTEYFDSNTYVGKAASGMVVAFDFNCDGKVKQIFVSLDDTAS